MSKQKELHRMVEQVLTEIPETRNDDFYLIYEVYERLEINWDFSFEYVLLNAKRFNHPSFESITRARRKIQAERPNLKPTEKVKDARKEKEQEMFEYAIDDLPN